MDIFSKIGDKVTNAGNAVVGKMGELGNTAGINNQISKEEQNIKERLFQIGKLYYEKHIDDYDPEFEPIMNAIKVSKENIAVLNEQKDEARHVIKCPSCNTENPNTGRFCISCGTPLPSAAAPVVTPEPIKVANTCPNCGAPIVEGNKFCVKCGNPIPLNTQVEEPDEPLIVEPEPAIVEVVEPESIVSESIEPEPIEPKPTEPEPIVADDVPEVIEIKEVNNTPEEISVVEKVCPRCGSVLDDDARFCTSCGNKL